MLSHDSRLLLAEQREAQSFAAFDVGLGDLTRQRAYAQDVALALGHRDRPRACRTLKLCEALMTIS